MLWNRFKQDREFLDIYAHPQFDTGTGLTDVKEINGHISKIKERSNALVKARACEFMLEKCAVGVNPKGWFGLDFAGHVPKLSHGNNLPIALLNIAWKNELSEGSEAVEEITPLAETGVVLANTDHWHYVPDWDAVLQYGFTGLRQRAKEYRDSLGTLSDGQTDFFDSVDIMLGACITFIERCIEQAKKRIDDDERMPLRIKCLENLAKGAPGNIYEALQLIYIFQLVGHYLECSQPRSLGDIDRLLYPFYLNDLYRGTFTSEQTKELLQYFFILFDFQSHTYNQPVSIAGTDIFGKPAINELTELILDAYYDADLFNLKIHIFVNQDTPAEFIKKTMGMIRSGKGSFVFMNTDVGVKSMIEAYDTDVKPYMLGSQGCYNFNIKGQPQHRNQVAVNLPKIMEMTVSAGVDLLTGRKVGADTPCAEELDSFDKFHEAFYAQLDEVLDKSLAYCHFEDGIMAEVNPSPLQSSTFKFSLESGKDCFSFGVTSFLLMGVGTVADCLRMVQKYVYEQKKFTLPELREMLKADWDGYENIRLMLYNDPEKYGNNLEKPDAFAVELSDALISRITGRKNALGYNYVCHFETIDRCFRSGEVTAATPDGRKARSAFSKNLNAAFGQDRNGVTANMLSAAKLDIVHMPIGAPVDFMLHPSATKGEEGLDAMTELLFAFLRMGGCALQGNVLDAETLREAQKHPEMYRNLQVRVSGWNWPFVEMSKEYQDAFILQAEAAE